MKEDKPGWQKARSIGRVYIKYEPKNNLPTHESTLPNQRDKEFKVLPSDVCVTNKANQKLTPSHKELLRWHFRLGHIGFQHVQWLICTGRMKVQVNSKAVANCERPKCAACEFGKGHIRPNKINTIKNNPMKEQELKKDHLLPGQMVSADHYISWAPGRLYHTKGKSDQSEFFSGGFFFIDHDKGYVRIKHQVDINATYTVKEKITFER